MSISINSSITTVPWLGGHSPASFHYNCDSVCVAIYHHEFECHETLFHRDFNSVNDAKQSVLMFAKDLVEEHNLYYNQYRQIDKNTIEMKLDGPHSPNINLCVLFSPMHLDGLKCQIWESYNLSSSDTNPKWVARCRCLNLPNDNKYDERVNPASLYGTRDCNVSRLYCVVM
jgi:hypothetical protein